MAYSIHDACTEMWLLAGLVAEAKRRGLVHTQNPSTDAVELLDIRPIDGVRLTA
jgi:hypothetical protein